MTTTPCAPWPPARSGRGYRSHSSRRRGRRWTGRPAHTAFTTASNSLLSHTLMSYRSRASVLNIMMGMQGVMHRLREWSVRWRRSSGGHEDNSPHEEVQTAALAQVLGSVVDLTTSTEIGEAAWTWNSERSERFTWRVRPYMSPYHRSSCKFHDSSPWTCWEAWGPSLIGRIFSMK